MIKNPLAKLNDLLTSLNSYEFATLGFVIGVVLSDGLTSDQLNSLGNFYELIGQTILTIQAQIQIGNDSNYNIQLNDAINMLKNKIGNIEQIIADFKNLN